LWLSSWFKSAYPRLVTGADKVQMGQALAKVSFLQEIVQDCFLNERFLSKKVDSPKKIFNFSLSSYLR